MNDQYELQFGYIHCAGKTIYSAGFVESERQAVRWVKENQKAVKKRVKTPKEDPICWCPVKNCHLKRQRPWFAYRLAV